MGGMFPAANAIGREGRFGMIFAETHVRFASPGFYEEHVRVDVGPTELRRSSVKLAFQMVCEADERLIAEGWGTLVGYDYEQGARGTVPGRGCREAAGRRCRMTDFEVERKFLLPAPPKGLTDHPSKRLEQGYLAIDPWDPRSGSGARTTRR